MIAIKGGTKTFGNSTGNHGFKADNTHSVSAGEKEKVYGDKDLGALLNKVADPNWVDPAKKMKQAGDSDLGKDAFMKMLLAQLQNQDPTNPMKSHQMAAQLAQFSSLEKLDNINKNIETLNKNSVPDANFDALKLIGKAVSGDSSKIFRNDLEDRHEIGFEAKADTKEVHLTIFDADNNPVREITLYDLPKGRNTFEWDGVIEDGSKARQGEYKVGIKAIASNGSQIATETRFAGKITGVNFTPHGPVLMIGSRSVKMSDVKSILDASALESTKTNRAVVSNGIRKAEIEGSAKLTEEKSVANAKGSQLNDVGMSREMINRLEKTGIETNTN